MRKPRWLLLSVSGLLTLALVAGAWLFGGTSVASAVEMTAEDLQAITQSTSDPGLLGDGYLAHGGWGRGGPEGIDYQQLLADALGITVEELQVAREEANQAALKQAIEEGILTQEEVDQMLAQKNLQSYLRRDALLAEALGMAAEDLQAAYAEGKTLSDLMAEEELDAATVRERLQTAYAEAIAQAVEDGVITQEQADGMLSSPGFGYRGFGPGMMVPGNRGDLSGFPGHGGFHGRGGFEGQCPSPPGAEDDSSGASLRRPGRSMQADSTL